MAEPHADRSFLPAAGHDLFLPFYDPFSRLLGADRVRRRLIDQAALEEHQRALEIGCGTGALLLPLARRHPSVKAVGLDPDSRALDRARRKARRAGVTLELDRGFSNALPYPASAFDRVLSCLMFHHVADDEKDATLREVLRVLKPGGRFEMVDFAGPSSSGHGRWLRLFHTHERLHENSEERVLARMNDAGFARAEPVGSGSLLVGRVVFYQATAPS